MLQFSDPESSKLPIISDWEFLKVLFNGKFSFSFSLNTVAISNKKISLSSLFLIKNLLPKANDAPPSTSSLVPILLRLKTLSILMFEYFLFH